MARKPATRWCAIPTCAPFPSPAAPPPASASPRRAGIKRLSMELGGKSPVLVFEDAASSARWTRRCSPSSRSTANAAPPARASSCSARSTTASPAGFAERRAPDRGRPARPGHQRRLDDHAPALGERSPATSRSAAAKSAWWRPAAACRPGCRRAWPRSNFVQPTVLTGVDNRMRVAQEEIFGPVVCLIPSTTRTRACGWPTTAATGWRPSGQDVGKAHRLARGIEAGMVFVSSQNVRDLRQPFGGIRTRAWAARAATPAWRPSAR